MKVVSCSVAKDAAGYTEAAGKGGCYNGWEIGYTEHESQYVEKNESQISHYQTSRTRPGTAGRTTALPPLREGSDH